MSKKKRPDGIRYVPKTVTLDCPTCSSLVGASVVGHYAYLQEGADVVIRYLFTRCPGCGSPLIAAQENFGDWNNDHCFDDPVLILPARPRVSTAVPQAVAGALEEAGRCFGARAYRATALMCRKALEALVSEHKIKARNLADGLKKLRDQGLIETRLFEWADALRLAGNNAAHHVRDTISKEDANDILDFTGALTEYVFTFRDRFDKFEKRRGDKKSLT